MATDTKSASSLSNPVSSEPKCHFVPLGAVLTSYSKLNEIEPPHKEASVFLALYARCKLPFG
jgi:hypothetical protein